MHQRKKVYTDPDRYVKTPAEVVAQELTVLGGTVSILKVTLEKVNTAAIRNGQDHIVGGLLFTAVGLIRKLDADSAHRFAAYLFNKLDDMQMQQPWTVRQAVPFLNDLIQKLREGEFDALTRSA